MPYVRIQSVELKLAERSFTKLSALKAIEVRLCPGSGEYRNAEHK
jgi:hypothetical protein